MHLPSPAGDSKRPCSTRWKPASPRTGQRPPLGSRRLSPAHRHRQAPRAPTLHSAHRRQQLHVPTHRSGNSAHTHCLDAGTSAPRVDQDAYQPLHLAVKANDLTAPARSTLATDRRDLLVCAPRCVCAGKPRHGGDAPRGGGASGLQEHDRTALHALRLLLRKSAKAESSVPLNRKWMCGGLSEPHSANLLYLAMGLRLPRSEYSPEPPPEERRKVPMAMLLVYGARKEVEMKIIGEYLKLWPRLQMEPSATRRIVVELCVSEESWSDIRGMV
ncbi:hypothetical protein B0H13DRAFT_2267000 [Mycena leptocephala]|nr:hypothetical protein B0H13DRAFT_2267000 [Mycena leptocephala]